MWGFLDNTSTGAGGRVKREMIATLLLLAGALFWQIASEIQAQTIIPTSSKAATKQSGDLSFKVDRDGDGIPDSLDNCPDTFNPDQLDFDRDGIGDVCDLCTDSDDDGYGDQGYPLNTCPNDNCPTVWNPLQTDSNGDGIGDACTIAGQKIVFSSNRAGSQRLMDDGPGRI